ncbi:MAG: hypothetical protein AAF141_05820 [Pseudomonadota bacterium]
MLDLLLGNWKFAVIAALATAVGLLWWRLDAVATQRDDARAEVASLAAINEANKAAYKQATDKLKQSLAHAEATRLAEQQRELTIYNPIIQEIDNAPPEDDAPTAPVLLDAIGSLWAADGGADPAIRAED